MDSLGCAIRRGFFVLQPCQQPMIAICSACQRPVCSEHSDMGTVPPLCVECGARQHSYDHQHQHGSSFHSTTTYYGYRSSYYHDRHYAPVDQTTATSSYGGLTPTDGAGDVTPADGFGGVPADSSDGALDPASDYTAADLRAFDAAPAEPGDEIETADSGLLDS